MNYAEWAERHLSLFGLAGDAALASAREWATHFKGQGESPAELWAASQWLAANAPPKGLWDHLDALRQRVAAQKRDTLAAAPAFAEHDTGTCIFCGGSGWAIRRRPSELGGSVHHRTFAITCLCWKGRNKHAVLLAKPLPSMKGPPLSLEEYRRCWPHLDKENP